MSSTDFLINYYSYSFYYTGGGGAANSKQLKGII